MIALAIDPTVWVALISALSATSVALIVYRRSTKGDKIAKEAGLATVEQSKINVVVAGLENLVRALQEDNAVLRLNFEELNTRLATIRARCDELEKIVRELRAAEA